jgi:hypothetical protein
MQRAKKEKIRGESKHKLNSLIAVYVHEYESASSVEFIFAE